MGVAKVAYQLGTIATEKLISAGRRVLPASRKAAQKTQPHAEGYSSVNSATSAQVPPMAKSVARTPNQATIAPAKSAPKSATQKIEAEIEKLAGTPAKKRIPQLYLLEDFKSNIMPLFGNFKVGHIFRSFDKKTSITIESGLQNSLVKMEVSPYPRIARSLMKQLSEGRIRINGPVATIITEQGELAGTVKHVPLSFDKLTNTQIWGRTIEFNKMILKK